MTFVPDIDRLNQIFPRAQAFFLAVIAAFLALMSTRLTHFAKRIRNLNAIGSDDQGRLRLKSDMARLVRRKRLVNNGITLAVFSGISASTMIALVFASEFPGLKHAFGAPALFMISTMLLAAALFRFAQDARISLTEINHFA